MTMRGYGHGNQVRAEVVALRRARVPWADVEAQTGVSRNTAKRWTHEAGLEPIYRGKQYDQATVDLALAMYRSGERLIEIEAATGASGRTIWVWACEAGIKRKRRPVNNPQKPDALKLYADGWNSRDIAEILKVGKRTILRWIHEAGITPRPKGSAPKLDAVAIEAHYRESRSLAKTAAAFGCSTFGVSHACTRAMRMRVRAEMEART